MSGRKGTFLLAHEATMDTTDPASAKMNIHVVKNTGTGELIGLEGMLAITIDASGHSYEFNYTLPEK